jgi:hypothetical protein
MWMTGRRSTTAQNLMRMNPHHYDLANGVSIHAAHLYAKAALDALLR